MTWRHPPALDYRTREELLRCRKVCLGVQLSMDGIYDQSSNQCTAYIPRYSVLQWSRDWAVMSQHSGNVLYTHVTSKA